MHSSGTPDSFKYETQEGTSTSRSVSPKTKCRLPLVDFAKFFHPETHVTPIEIATNGSSCTEFSCDKVAEKNIDHGSPLLVDKCEANFAFPESEADGIDENVLDAYFWMPSKDPAEDHCSIGVRESRHLRHVDLLEQLKNSISLLVLVGWVQKVTMGDIS
jgi:hypothetical protein